MDTIEFIQQPVAEKLIQDYMAFDRDEYGLTDSNNLRELVLLELEDLKRKGCLLYGPYCLNCPVLGKDCPLNDWQTRHPEYANDELWEKIQSFYVNAERVPVPEPLEDEES